MILSKYEAVFPSLDLFQHEALRFDNWDAHDLLHSTTQPLNAVPPGSGF